MAVTINKGIIKMPDAGDTHTMHVAKCEVVEGQYGEQVKFTDKNGDQLFIGRETADRQLGRCGFVDEEAILYSDVDGQTLIFSRESNPKGKPYWNIAKTIHEDVSHRPSLVEQAKAEAERVRQAKKLPPDEPAKPPVAAPPMQDGDLQVDAIDRAYAHAYMVAAEVQGEDATAEALQAGAATLFIAYGRANLYPLFTKPVGAQADEEASALPF